ncbi:hypothetical protein RGU70_00070 [Herbaspirillum sp. RTI4]|uniref:hypothetical protein n=1 Tax=Herbaspirillum sp. RTI4 TaxID=3048640 RepID=UPI002AB459B0|nr:hypothetical protein [Herbaspirillum sp. RTI4]MDY7576720.1 hypothetical protein [Herbaspirillum sp. RTI4]MEA9983602.1 hypothetical protein [Herbaspirillum sp. RTI4]
MAADPEISRSELAVVIIDEVIRIHKRWTNRAKAHCIESVENIKNYKMELQNGERSFRVHSAFTGQSWTRAGAMLISVDQPTQEAFADRVGVDAILSTVHAKELGRMYKEIERIVTADSSADLDLWKLATNAGADAVAAKPQITQQELAIVIVDEVLRIHEIWKNRALDVTPLAWAEMVDQ